MRSTGANKLSVVVGGVSDKDAQETRHRIVSPTSGFSRFRAAFSFMHELAMLALLLNVLPAWAQMYVTVAKTVQYAQTSATTLTLGSDMYGFDADVDGLNGLATPPSIRGPFNAAAIGSWFNGGNLLFSAGDHGWRMGNPYADDWGKSPTQSALDSLFGNGTYTFNVGGAQIPLKLTGDAYPNPPQLTLSGGAWSNGKYVINPSQPLSITTNAFTAYGSHVDDRIIIGIVGGNITLPFASVSPFDFAWAAAKQNHSVVPSPNYLSYTVPANTFVDGQDYMIVVLFHAFVDASPAPPNSTNVAYYETSTFASISASSSAPLPTALLTVTKSGSAGLGTIVSSPAGINCGSTCSASIASGTTVTLTATPASGTTFTGWSGDCTGTSTCTVTMNAAKNVTANFALATPTSYTLSVTKAGKGDTGLGSGTVTSVPPGIDCGSTCSATFPSASNVTLTATPVAGFTFWGWSGACTGTGTCTVTMNAAKNVTATFNPIPFSVLTAGVTDGVITAPIATVTTTIQFNPPDVGKTGSVFITALVPANALGAFGITQSGTKSLRSVAINAVTDSSAPVLIQLTPSGWQPVTNGQLIPYATGVLGDQLAAQTILKSTDTSNLKGTQICLGYGTSVADMTANSKMQLVAIVPDPNATNPNTGSCLITPWSISASNQGAGAQDVTLQIVFTPDLSDRNSPLNLYVAGLFGGQYYFVTQTNSNINVVQYSGGSLPVYSVGNGANLTTQGWTIPLGDLTTLHGLQIYTGLGRSDSDMLNKGQVKLIYSVN